MQVNPMKAKKTDDAPSRERRKAEYRPPELLEYGTLADLTGGATVQPPNDSPPVPTPFSGQGGK